MQRIHRGVCICAGIVTLFWKGLHSFSKCLMLWMLWLAGWEGERGQPSLLPSSWMLPVCLHGSTGAKESLLCPEWAHPVRALSKDLAKGLPPACSPVCLPKYIPCWERGGLWEFPLSFLALPLDVSTIAAEFSFRSCFPQVLLCTYWPQIMNSNFLCLQQLDFFHFSFIVNRDSTVHCSKSNQQSCIGGFLSYSVVSRQVFN